MNWDGRDGPVPALGRAKRAVVGTAGRGRGCPPLTVLGQLRTGRDSLCAVISVELARLLRDSGLEWRPARYDVFFIPDRGLDDRVFVLADMTIEVQPLAGGAAITFNGAVEWSLDSILHRQVVWLPTEAQLRSLVGERLVALTRDAGEYVCAVDTGDGIAEYRDGGASNAYGQAILALLELGLLTPLTPDQDAVGPFGRESRPDYSGL